MSKQVTSFSTKRKDKEKGWNEFQTTSVSTSNKKKTLIDQETEVLRRTKTDRLLNANLEMREASQRMLDLSNELALVHQVFSSPDNYTVQSRKKMLININSIMVPFCKTVSEKLEAASTKTNPIPAVKEA